MKVFFISPIGFTTPMLFDTFIPIFQEQGHSIVTDIGEADVVFFDLYSKVGGLYYGEYFDVIFKKKLPLIIFDATDYGGMSKEIFALEEERGMTVNFTVNKVVWREFVLYLTKHTKTVYFIRKMDKSRSYPKICYPYELCLYPDHDFELTTREELFSRPNDICFIGNTSPQRESICNELQKHFKCDFVLGQERIPHNEWLDRARKAKMFCSISGGGWSDERPYQLITLAVMIKDKNNHLQADPFMDHSHCMDVSEVPTEAEIYNLKDILSAKHNLYHIYEQGIWHMKKYFNFQYRANYILNILNQNGIC